MSSRQNDYLKLLEDSFATMAELEAEAHTLSRLYYLGDHIFNFTTYDSGISELFARKALEVCEAVTNQATFDYIKDADNYRWYLLICNMPFFVDKLEWGMSIRGAWWGGPGGASIRLDTFGLWRDQEQITQPLEFTCEQWEDFTRAMVEFAGKDKEGAGVEG